jgi:hypothetical protein
VTSRSEPAPAGPALAGVLTADRALGSVRTSNRRGAPIPGNDFVSRYAEDLAVLAERGVTAIRLGFDWSRLQPVPGRLDDDWREWYGSVLAAAEQCGMGVWAALHEDTVPAWFDDEGSFLDERAAGRSWPRWVEHVAEEFGDRVAGWFPIVDPVGAAARWSSDSMKHERALVNLATAWRDSWRILRGGPPVSTALALSVVAPVDHTVPAAEAARFEDHVRWRLWLRALRDGVVRLPNGREHVVAELNGSLDQLGATTSLDVPEGVITDDTIRRWQERFGTVMHRLAEDGPERPILLAGLDIRWSHRDERRLFVEATVDAIGAARRDGLALGSVFVDPAIGSTRGDRAAIVDRDRSVSDNTDAWQAILRGGTRPAPPHS